MNGSQQGGPVHVHPYAAFEGTPVWVTLNQAIEELVENNDLVEQTNRNYIVGFLCKHLSEVGSQK
jgi:hypothetical protein